MISDRIIPVGQWRGKAPSAEAQTTFEAALKGDHLGKDDGSSPANDSAPKKAVESCGLSSTYAKEVLSKCSPLEKAACDLGIAQVSLATAKYIECAQEQALVLEMLAKFKRPTDLSFIGTNVAAAH